jgi:hypothetical protein
MTHPHPQDANDLLMSGGVKAVKFAQGVPVVSTIADTPRVAQMVKFTADGKPTEELDFWPSGDPKMQIVVTVDTNLRDPEDPNDQGRRRLHITPRMMPAVREAVRNAHAKGITVGGRLALCWTSGSGQGAGNAKEWAAEYSPPVVDVGSMLGGATPTAPVQPATPMLAQPAPAAAPAPSPTMASLAAAQPAAAPAVGSMLGAPPVSAAPPPHGVDPAVWATLPDTQRQAVLAAMASPAAPGVPAY